MSRTSTLGLIGGILIAVTVFLSGNTITFSSDALTNTTALVLFVAGIAVAAFSVSGRRLAASYAATVAGTIALIQVVEWLRGGAGSIAVAMVVLVVGVVLAFIASVGSRRG